MFTTTVQDASASTASPATASSPAFPASVRSPNDPAKVRHLLYGTLATVQATIKRLHQQGYAEPNDWSQPIATGQPNEVMTIMTKRVRLERKE